MTRFVVVALALALAAASAHAAPLHQIVIDVELDQIDTTAFDQQPLRWSSEEPGGLAVPADPNASWRALGLRAGDLVVRENGQPAHKSPTYLSEGTLLYDVVRDGKPVQLRIVVHGESHHTVEVDDSDVHFIESYTADRPERPIAMPVTWNGAPSGVRIVDDLPSMRLALGDIVRTIGAAEIRSNDALLAALENLPLGDSDMVLERDGRTVVVTLQRQPPVDLSAIVQVAPNVFELPEQLAHTIANDPIMITGHARFARNARGMEIVAIDPGSLLAIAGLRAGDTIVGIGDTPIDWDEDHIRHEAFILSYRVWQKRVPLTIRVWRGGKTIALVYQLPRKT